MDRLQAGFEKRLKKHQQQHEHIRMPGKLARPTFEYRYVGELGQYQIRYKSKGRWSKWRIAHDFTGQTFAEFREYMNRKYGPKLLAVRDLR